MHHWTSMAGMALAIVLLGLLASLRTRGWRIVVWLAAAGSAVYGLASIVFATFPGTSFPYPGGEGVGWGLLAIVGGIALVAASELDRRRSPSV
jgi:peptidoglycan/LPS O-acetylase OafA/YrhL